MPKSKQQIGRAGRLYFLFPDKKKVLDTLEFYANVAPVLKSGDGAMENLIAKYLANPTVANAKKLATYATKHPMARVVLGNLGHAVLAQAIAVQS